MTYKELFIEQNNEYIFSIVFDENSDNKDATWILGKIFMKKYQLVYDLDRKIIGLYKENNNKENDEKSNGLFIVSIILIPLLVIIVLALTIVIIYLIAKKRRQRACELNDDNFDYIPSE